MASNGSGNANDKTRTPGARGSRLPVPAAAAAAAPVATTPRGFATPNRRAGNADPISAGRLMSSARRGQLTFNNNATPHAQAARRNLDSRRETIFRPANNRRRSLRDNRGTPHNVLRELSRVLAKTSQPMSSSTASSSSPRPGPAHDDNNTSTRRSMLSVPDGAEDDDDDDFLPPRPRLSLPNMDRDDDDDDLPPPRLSGLEEFDYTATSIELPRRAYTEAPLPRLSGVASPGGRFSDFPGPDDDDVGIDSGFFPPPAGFDDDTTATRNLDPMVEEEEVVIETLDADEERQRRLSDFGPIEIPDIGNESTFVMGAPAAESSPTRGDQEAEGDNDQDNDNDMMPAFEDDYDDFGGEGPSPGPFDEGGFDDNDDDNDNDNAPMFNSDDAPLGDQEPPNPEDEPTFSGAFSLPARRSTMMAPTAAARSASPGDDARLLRGPAAGVRKKRPTRKVSRHGIEYPTLPMGVIKKLATTFARTAGGGKLSADALDAAAQATDWFFEQLGDDLAAYAGHAGRRTVDEPDMLTLMRRQRQTGASTTPFALAQRHLPRELLQELRMPVPAPTSKGRRAGKRKGAEERRAPAEDDEETADAT